MSGKKIVQAAFALLFSAMSLLVALFGLLIAIGSIGLITDGKTGNGVALGISGLLLTLGAGKVTQKWWCVWKACSSKQPALLLEREVAPSHEFDVLPETEIAQPNEVAPTSQWEKLPDTQTAQRNAIAQYKSQWKTPPKPDVAAQTASKQPAPSFGKMMWLMWLSLWLVVFACGSLWFMYIAYAATKHEVMRAGLVWFEIFVFGFALLLVALSCKIGGALARAFRAHDERNRWR